MDCIKMPSTILQEMMVKIGASPVYELCADEHNLHPPLFTFKVTCDGVTAYGSGKSKKDAKQQAAKTMLEKITQRKIVTSATKSTARTSENNFQDNNVQELMRLCNKLQLEEPTFTELETTGPPHDRIYSTQCKVSKFQLDATARTKKQAKQIAAWKMIDKLRDTFDVPAPTNNNINEHTNMDDIDHNKNSVELSQLDIINKASKVKIDYHLKLQSERKQLMDNFGSQSSVLLSNLEEIIVLYRSCQSDSTDSKYIIKLKQKFQETMDSANIDFHHMLLQTPEPTTFMLIIQLNIVPDIIEMSIGKSRQEAEWRTIGKIVQTLKALLN